MHTWSIDMARQTGWDLWVGVCLAASVVLAVTTAAGWPWATGRARAAAVLAAAGVLGTLVVVALPPLHDGRVGLAWTFALLSLLSAAFYLNLREQLSVGRTGVLLGMRIVALAVLVPMLFEPVAAVRVQAAAGAAAAVRGRHVGVDGHPRRGQRADAAAERVAGPPPATADDRRPLRAELLHVRQPGSAS